jgi:hypothetical protein
VSLARDKANVCLLKMKRAFGLVGRDYSSLLFMPLTCFELHTSDYTNAPTMYFQLSISDAYAVLLGDEDARYAAARSS